MAELEYVTRQTGLAGAVLSAPAGIPPTITQLFTRATGLASAQGGKDWRIAGDTGGTISDNNRVMLKADPSAPEVPFVGARVRLHRLSDGYLAWQGHSDGQGYYWPRGLEVGVAYYPVAIDLTGAHECDAAGPVVATQAI